MSYQTLIGQPDFLESLRGKNATFLLTLSNTKTYEVEGITQAGIPGMIHLTPTLDCEFVCTGEVRSLQNIAETPKGVPTPALMTRAVHLLKPFSNIEWIDLGLEIQPKIDYFKSYQLDVHPSQSIDKGADINAMELFQKGVAFGQSYESKDEYVILAESVPAGTTTAQATAQALGYEVEGKFASSFKEVPHSIKKQVLQDALLKISYEQDLFEKIGSVSDNMIIFNAGFILGSAAHQQKIVLAGGTQMATVLLLVNSILELMGGEFDASNLALCTTSWIADDTNSDIKALLGMLSFDINVYASEFTFSKSNHPALKLYDQGEAKEGVGAGAALCYGMINGLKEEEIIAQVEAFLG